MERFWEYKHFEKQVADVMDALETLHRNKQLVLEEDNPAGHANYRAHGLRVSNMNVKYGDKQKTLRDLTMTEDCFGLQEAKIYLRGLYLRGRFLTIKIS